jgi:hypothetical protein
MPASPTPASPTADAGIAGGLGRGSPGRRMPLQGETPDPGEMTQMSILHVAGRVGFSPLAAFTTPMWAWHCKQCGKVMGVSRRATDLPATVQSEVCPANWWRP